MVFVKAEIASITLHGTTYQPDEEESDLEQLEIQKTSKELQQKG